MTENEFFELLANYKNLSWWEKYQMLWCTRAGRVRCLWQHRQWRELLVWCFYEVWDYDTQVRLEQAWQRLCRWFVNR